VKLVKIWVSSSGKTHLQSPREALFTVCGIKTSGTIQEVEVESLYPIWSDVCRVCKSSRNAPSEVRL